MLGQPSEHEVVDAEANRLERVAAPIGCKVHLSVELGCRALPGEVSPDVRFTGPARRVREGVDDLDAEAACACRLRGRERRGLVTTTHRAVDDDQIRAHRVTSFDGG